MRIRLDREACTGQGRCYALAPLVYSFDEDGYCVVDGDREIPAELEDQARLGVENCPEAALTFRDDG